VSTLAVNHLQSSINTDHKQQISTVYSIDRLSDSINDSSNLT